MSKALRVIITDERGGRVKKGLGRGKTEALLLKKRIQVAEKKKADMNVTDDGS